MSKVFVEENKVYQLDCSKALWATDKVRETYQKNRIGVLKDTDFVIEENDKIILLEYKNGNTVQAIKHGSNFDPNSVIDSIVKKYFDTLHYLNLLEKSKPRHYVWVLEYPHGSTITRKMLRNKIMKQLPFQLQASLSTKNKLIESFEVLSIDEWNENYWQYPMSRVK